MPRFNNNRRPQRQRRRPYRRSKLRDKKINTLIEKRIRDIAQKEDQKQLKYITAAKCWPQSLANPDYAGVSIIELADLLPTVNYSGATASQNSLEYVNLSSFDLGERAEEIRVKQVQAFLSFYNTNVDPYMVSAALIHIPNANIVTAASSNSTAGETNDLIPRRFMLTKNNWKFSKSSSGMFHGFVEGDAPRNTTKYTILDRKTVVVPPASVNSDSDNSNPKRVIEMKLNKSYKTYKTIKYNSSTSTSGNQPTRDGNIYLCVTCNKGAASTADSGIRVQAIGGIKYTLGPTIAPTVDYVTPE